ncbi:MAG TPA: hypothetical protein PLP34_09125, partial [Chitinophagaceae bacterium]|nr:hypothetical protein [Chitinophagaceae bacterium]
MRIAFIILSILRLFTVSMNAHAESIPSSAAYQLIHSKEGFQFQQYPTVQFAALQQWICDNQEEDDSHTPEC